MQFSATACLKGNAGAGIGYALVAQGPARIGRDQHQTMRRLATLVLLATVAFVAGACQAVSLPNPATDQAILIGDLYNLVFVVAAVAAVLAGVIALMIPKPQVEQSEQAALADVSAAAK